MGDSRVTDTHARRSTTHPVFAVTVAMCALTLLCCAEPRQAPLARASTPPAPAGLLEDERNTIEVFKKASPAVVYITNKRLRRQAFSLNTLEIPQGSGSGFVWDRDGHVVTNFHVIQAGDVFTVSFEDGSTYDAQVVGHEANKDLAVLKVDAPTESLQPLRLGDSTQLIVGQKVLAIGNPFGLDHTLTTGIVSALGREMRSVAGTTIRDVIQTDASINPGNSGGPLLDSSGALVGVATAIYSPSGQSAGIGFAVPVATVKRVVPQLVAYGRVRRAGLGVTLFSDALVRNWGIRGAVIQQVLPGSAAHRAGLEGANRDGRGRIILGDIIVGIDEHEIHTYNDLFTALDRRSVGEQVSVQVARVGGEKRTVELDLIELDN